MATLYVENFPDDLHEAIKKRAKAERTSIAALVTRELGRIMPTPGELARRRLVAEEFRRLRESPSPGPGPFPSTEEMIREDRER